MLSKKVVKDIQSLGLKKERQVSGLFVAEGGKVVAELLQAMPENLVELYATVDWKEPSPLSEKAVRVSDDELKKLSHLATPNNVLAVFKQMPSQPPTDGGLVLYLDTIQDPGNFGTILRIADWFGVRDVVCSPGCADRYNPKVVQSTMASIARVNVVEDADENWLAKQSRPVVAATLSGKPLSAFEKMENGVLLIGNESRGVRPEFLAMASSQVTIPQRGEAESLNAAVATGILLSHLL